jgi:hypothetical protein
MRNTAFIGQNPATLRGGNINGTRFSTQNEANTANFNENLKAKFKAYLECSQGSTHHSNTETATANLISCFEQLQLTATEAALMGTALDECAENAQLPGNLAIAIANPNNSLPINERNELLNLALHAAHALKSDCRSVSLFTSTTSNKYSANYHELRSRLQQIAAAKEIPKQSMDQELETSAANRDALIQQMGCQDNNDYDDNGNKKPLDYKTHLNDLRAQRDKVYLTQNDRIAVNKQICTITLSVIDNLKLKLEQLFQEGKRKECKEVYYKICEYYGEVVTDYSALANMVESDLCEFKAKYAVPLAQIYHEFGVVYRDQKQYKLAQNQFEKSLAIQLNRADRDNAAIAKAYFYLALNYQDQSNNLLALKNYRLAGAYLKHSDNNNDLLHRAECMDQIALLYESEGKLHQSVQYLEDSLKLKLKIHAAVLADNLELTPSAIKTRDKNLARCRATAAYSCKRLSHVYGLMYEFQQSAYYYQQSLNLPRGIITASARSVS